MSTQTTTPGGTLPEGARAPARAGERVGTGDARGDARGAGSPWLLAVCCVAQFMVILDLSIVNVALPHIQLSLGFSAPELQWVVDAYAITFAGFLMLGGRAADHFGQRRTFVAALALFALTSLAGGLAPDRGVLVGARAAQGFAGALMAACSLAIITATFEPGPKLNRAVGIWAAMNGLGGAAGALFGGIITELLSWRWVLLINPPIAIATALVAYMVVNERRRARAEDSFDLAGALTLTLGQMTLVYGVVEAGLKGWGASAALLPIALGLILLVAFGAIEARASAPLIPFKELTKTLRAANTIVLLFSAALFPMWFISSLYLQQVLGLSAFHTGLIFLPMTLTIMLVASRAGRLVSRFGVRAVLVGGLVMMTAGLILFTRIGASGSGVIYVMIPGLLTAAGIAMSIVPSTIAATQGAKEGQAGLASGLVNTSRQVGGGLGLAVIITLATQRTSHLIGARSGVLAALTHGFRLAYLICAILAALAAALTFLTLPRPRSSLGGAPRRLALVIAAVLAIFVATTVAFAGSHSPLIGAYTKRGAYAFVSAPALHPPKIVVTTADAAGATATAAPVTTTTAGPTAAAAATTSPGATTGADFAPGYVFVTNFFNLNEPPLVGQSGPLILDDRLQPVWFKPVPESVAAANLSLQTYEGKPALAWWQGVVTNTGATESGEDVVVDQHYRTVARLHGADGWKITLHELVIDGHDAWVTANKDIPMDLSRYGGAYNGALTDVAVQKYDLRTGRLLYNWDALDHIPPSDSYATVPTNGFPWDAYHVNSISLAGAGGFLVSMRNTWAAYMVDGAGQVDWTLGGRRSSFKLGAGAAFQWQHDVVLQPGSTVSLFDDHCCQLTGGGTSVPATAPSRGLILRLDQQDHTATLVAQYRGDGHFETEYMGDTQPLPGGAAMVGWGSEPSFALYNRSGQTLLEGRFPGSDLSYRATVEPWVGLPLDPPVGAARRSDDGGVTVYASWNGATRLAAWRILATSATGVVDATGGATDVTGATDAAGGGGASGAAGAGSAAGPLEAAGAANAAGPGSGRLRVVVARARKSGFETAIPVGGAYRSFQAQALDARGRVIGTSSVFSAG